MDIKANNIHLSKIKKIVYVVCSLMLILSLTVYLNKEHIFNATCKKEDFRTVLVKNLYNFTDESLKNNDLDIYVAVGKSISKSELYDLFDVHKEATIKALESTYQLKSIHDFPLSKVFKFNDDNIAYTLIFPRGDGGMYSVYPSESFFKNGNRISTETYTFDVTNKGDFTSSMSLIKKRRLRIYKLIYNIASCNTLDYYSIEHN